MVGSAAGMLANSEFSVDKKTSILVFQLLFFILPYAPASTVCEKNKKVLLPSSVFLSVETGKDISHICLFYLQYLDYCVSDTK